MTTRPSSRSRRRALGALALTLAGCMGYDYKLNERVVFQGPRLFVDYAIADEHLRACVAQAISDNRITRPEALEDLNCSQAGIAPLYPLRQLELLQLRGNRIAALDARLCQGAAKRIALAGNEALACADIAKLQACGARLIDVPAHCASPAP